MDIRCVGGRARCAVLVSHRCTVKAAELRANVAAGITAVAIVATLGALIGRAM